MQERAATLPHRQHEVIDQSFEDFQTVLEELKVAEEELRVQNTQLAVAVDAIQAERKRYEELFEFAPDGYLVTDKDGTISEANHAASKMLGKSKKLLAGKPLSIYVDSEYQQAFLSELNRLIVSNSEASFETLLRPRNGEPFYAALKVAQVRDPEGKLTGLRWLVRDVTEQKQAEAEIRALNAQLEQRVNERTAQLQTAEREVVRLKLQTEPQPRLPVGNAVLASLSQQAYDNILPNLEEVALPLGEILYRPDDLIDYIYFPTTGMISLVSITAEGGTIEVGMAGKDGIIGLPLFLGAARSPFLITVQISGEALRMKADLFKVESARQGSMHRAMLRYAYVMLTQLTQSVVCNRFHSLDERFCRWLLMAQDCAGMDSFALTQEFISQMLGVRRSGVTVAAGLLQEKGLIKYTRGHITILDRPGIEENSCECYQIVKEQTHRLLGI